MKRLRERARPYVLDPHPPKDAYPPYRPKKGPSARAYGLKNVHLYEGEEWIDVRDAVGDDACFAAACARYD